MPSPDQFLQRRCPLCASPTASAQEVTSARPAETLPLEDLKGYWNGFFKEKVFFSYVRCSSCGLLFNPVFFTQQQLASLYAGMPPNMESIPPAALRATQRGYYDWLKANSTFQGAYLEVGPDVGYFVENCVRADGFARYWLFEPNRDVACALGAAVAGREHTIVHEMTDFEVVPDETVGAAVMIHVLDHLLDPMDTLVQLRRKLAPGGRVLIVTHDESSVLRRVFGARWPPFCLQHPQLYRPRTMAAMLKAAGFGAVRLKRTVNHFPVAFLLKQFLWATGLKVETTPAFGGATVALALGNMMAIGTA